MSVETTGDVIIGASRGLSLPLAQRLRDRAHRVHCTAILDNRRGHSADARNLFQLLLLGLPHGDQVTVRCDGPDARKAFETVADLLEDQGGTT